MVKAKIPLIHIIDDSDLTRQSVNRVFDDYVCKIENSEDGLFGIQKAITLKPDLIILDILMPNLDGIKTLQIKNLINELKSIPVIILSGNVNKSNMIAAIENGADKVIIKPFDANELINAVNELLGFQLEKKPAIISATQQGSLLDLKNIFFESFSTQKISIIEAVSARDKEKLKILSHQIKGIGSTVGLPKVTEICRSLEFNLASDKINWDFIINQCEKLFTIVSKAQMGLKVDS